MEKIIEKRKNKNQEHGKNEKLEWFKPQLQKISTVVTEGGPNPNTEGGNYTS